MMYTFRKEKENEWRISPDVAYLAWRISNLPEEDKTEMLDCIRWLLDGVEKSPGWLREWAGMWKRITQAGRASPTRRLQEEDLRLAA